MNVENSIAAPGKFPSLSLSSFRIGFTSYDSYKLKVLSPLSHYLDVHLQDILCRDKDKRVAGPTVNHEIDVHVKANLIVQPVVLVGSTIGL